MDRRAPSAREPGSVGVPLTRCIWLEDDLKVETGTAATLEPAAAAAPQPRPVRKPALPALTGVRSLLALNIMFFHFTPPHMGPFYPVINHSFVFIGFFFLLSGYVLAYNYADRPELTKQQFWLARFSRLYPVYVLSLIVSLKMLNAEWHVRFAQEFWTGLFLTPVLLQGWSQSLATFWNTVAWTLSAEMAMYLAFPWLVRLPWPRSPRKLAALVLVIWAVGLIPHMLYMLTNPDHLSGAADRYSHGVWLRTLKYTPLPYLCTFTAGIALGRLQSVLTLSDKKRGWIAVASLAVLVLFFAFAVDSAPYVLLHGGLMVPLFALLTLGLSGKNPIANFFSWGPLVAMGQTTFCLYLLHFNLMNLIRDYKLPQRLHVEALDPWISYAVVVLLAFAATYLVERPARKAILRLYVKQGSGKESLAD